MGEGSELAVTDQSGGEGTIAFDNKFDFKSLLSNAGNVKLTPKKKAALYEPVNEDEVEIRADGIVYLPWNFYQKKLIDAFDLNWAIIPNGNPQFREQDNLVVWGFYLVINGSLMGYAIGENNYHPKNQNMTWTDTCEGAKSNALMRLCKGIGISAELWQPQWIQNWLEKWAIVEWYVGIGNNNRGKNKQLWRRKDRDPYGWPWELKDKQSGDQKGNKKGAGGNKKKSESGQDFKEYNPGKPEPHQPKPVNEFVDTGHEPEETSRIGEEKAKELHMMMNMAINFGGYSNDVEYPEIKNYIVAKVLGSPRQMYASFSKSEAQQIEVFVKNAENMKMVLREYFEPGPKTPERGNRDNFGIVRKWKEVWAEVNEGVLNGATNGLHKYIYVTYGKHEVKELEAQFYNELQLTLNSGGVGKFAENLALLKAWIKDNAKI